jgi:hypothetical protein
MERLEAEKRMLQEKLEQPVSAPMSPRNPANFVSVTGQQGIGTPLGGNSSVSIGASASAGLSSGTTLSSGVQPSGMNILVGQYPLQGASSEQATNLTEHIINLRREVSRLKATLEKAERDHKENVARIVREEKEIREENLRLQRRLQMEVDRREALCRHLSESESSLEMDDERHFNESTRVRTVSSPVPGYIVNNNANSSSSAGASNSSNSTGSMMQTTTTAVSNPVASVASMHATLITSCTQSSVATGAMSMPPSGNMLFSQPINQNVAAASIERFPNSTVSLATGVKAPLALNHHFVSMTSPPPQTQINSIKQNQQQSLLQQQQLLNTSSSSLSSSSSSLQSNSSNPKLQAQTSTSSQQSSSSQLNQLASTQQQQHQSIQNPKTN